MRSVSPQYTGASGHAFDFDLGLLLPGWAAVEKASPPFRFPGYTLHAGPLLSAAGLSLPFPAVDPP